MMSETQSLGMENFFAKKSELQVRRDEDGYEERRESSRALLSNRMACGPIK